ncbi:MAG: methyltransferase domain-containing protein [Acidobacteriota bacterium]|nr:methyltransferase domain-containing protein [Acidobacteriota bacterium]
MPETLPLQTSAPPLPFEPLPAFRGGLMQDEAELAKCQGKRIGILIVSFNAVTTLTKVLKRITPSVWQNVEEVAVFDDASQDATYELAVGLKAMRNLPKLHVLHHEKNLGYGGNQKAGYKYFMDKGFDIVVLLHGDGQYAPEILAHIYNPIVKGEAQAVFGSRMMKTFGGPLKGGMPMYKYLGNRVLTIVENRALGLHLTEFHSGYRAYDLHALRQMDFSHMTNDFHFDTEIIIKLQHQHFTIREVPIPTYYGNEICYVNGMKYARDVFKAVYRYKQTSRSVQCFPEFREYFVHYPIKQSKASSHHYVAGMVGSGQDVLDIGCGEGFLARELKKSGNRITGIDALPAAAEGSALDDYYSADLNEGVALVVRQLRGRRFTRVLLLDILEHLKEPEKTLEECHDVLAKDGLLIVSVPNVANITVRLGLLFGQFNYTERGLLDKTHLRFFTRRTARRMMEEHGYRIVEEKLTVMPLELVLGMSPASRVMRGINLALRGMTKIARSLLGYQIMFVAQSTRYGAAEPRL